MRLLIIILGILIVLLTLISRLRLGLLAAIAGGEPTLSLRIGPASIHLYPPRKEASSAAPVPEEPKEIRVKKKTEGKLVKPGLSDLKDAWTVLWPPIRRALARTRQGIRIDPLDLSVTVGGAEDPAEAARTCGMLEMLVWTVMPALEQLLVITHPHIHVGVDFDVGKTRLDGTAAVTIRLGTLAAVALGAGIPVLRWFLKLQKRDTQPSKETPPTTVDAHA